LKALRGVEELSLDKAKLRAKQLDDRLRKGEIEYMFNPTQPNELAMLADFYEREVVDERRIDPTKIPDFDMLMNRYSKRAERLGLTTLEARFKILKRRG